MPDDQQLDSFVLRFIRAQPSEGESAPSAMWRGVVRHVQSDTEQPFAAWVDAVAFIARFVPLGEDPDEQ